MSMGGKGDKPRPYSVPLSTFDSNWDAIFGKKKQPSEEDLAAYNDERLVSKYDKASNDEKTNPGS